MLMLAAVFAELLASSAPVVAIGKSGVMVFPAVLHPARYAAMPRRDVEALHAKELALWPIIRYGPQTPGDAAPNARPSTRHPLGTDSSGRDLGAQLLYGARSALGASLAAVTIGLVLGVALGGLAGCERRTWHDRVSRFVETVHTFPSAVVVVLLQAVEPRPSVLSFVIAVALLRAAEVASLLRAELHRATADDYALAARALGAQPARIWSRHLLPSAVGAALYSSVIGMGSVVLLDTALAFLTMGETVSGASWGTLIKDGVASPGSLRLFLVPQAFVLATVGSCYLLASALRDAANPRR
jgi:peptide/nickel transport system permease protein